MRIGRSTLLRIGSALLGVRLRGCRLLAIRLLALLLTALRVGRGLLRRLINLIRLLVLLLRVALLVRWLRVRRVLSRRRGRRRIVRIHRLLRQHGDGQGKHSGGKDGATSHSAYENARSPG